MNTLYIIGEPGVGKSTLMAELTADNFMIQHRNPIPHIEFDGEVPWLPGKTVAQLGRVREYFSGTDALALNIQPKALAFIASRPYDWLLAEGDRLANEAFFLACQKAGRLHLVYLDSGGVAVERRLARGSNQDEEWVKGRVTKVRNLLDKFPPDLTLDARLSPEELSDKVKEYARRV